MDLASGRSNQDEAHAVVRMNKLLDDPLLRPLLDDLCNWLARILTIDIHAFNFTEPLQTGTDLCRLADAISKKAAEGGMECPTLKYKAGAKPGSFQARCNIEAFLKWSKALGVRETCLFETIDLVELKFLRNVLICLLEISKLADVYGVEPPELVKLEKDTSIGWMDLIKLSMKRTSTGNVMSLADITNTVGQIRREAESTEPDSGKEKTSPSSVVHKWREFARNSARNRVEEIAEETVSEDVEIAEETVSEDVAHSPDVEEPEVEEMLSDELLSEEILPEDVNDDTLTPSNALSMEEEEFQDCHDESLSDRQVDLVVEIEDVEFDPDIMTSSDNIVFVHSEFVDPVHCQIPPVEQTDVPTDFSLQIGVIDSPIVASTPTQIDILVRNETTVSNDSENVDTSEAKEDKDPPGQATEGCCNEGYESSTSEHSKPPALQHIPTPPDVQLHLTHEGDDEKGNVELESLHIPRDIPRDADHTGGDAAAWCSHEDHVTWCFALCYPVVIEESEKPLSDNQLEELDLKRLRILLLGIILTILGTSLAVVCGVFGTDNGTATTADALSAPLFFSILASALLCLIVGLSLISLWIVQDYKMKDRKKHLINYDNKPSYGTLQ